MPPKKLIKIKKQHVDVEPKIKKENVEDSPSAGRAMNGILKLLLLVSLTYLASSLIREKREVGLQSPSFGKATLQSKNNDTGTSTSIIHTPNTAPEQLQPRPEGWVPNQRDFDYCSSPGVNMVSDGGGSTENKGEPFSIRPQDFQIHPEQTEICSTLDQTVQAIRLGERQWDSPDPPTKWVKQIWRDREQRPSTFVPAGCHIPWLSPEEMCEILNQFSSIIIVGDAIARHIQAGMFTTLTNDFISGFPSLSKDLERCQCDGQLRDDPLCRQIGDIATIPAQKLCPKLSPQNIFEEHWAVVDDAQTAQTNFLESARLFGHCWEAEPNGSPRANNKGLLLVLQGGRHQGISAPEFIDSIAGPILSDGRLKLCSQVGRLYVLWHSMEWESSVEELLPNSAPAPPNVQEFNTAVRQYLSSISKNTVVVMDWVNMTKGTPSSDGLRRLLNVNYFKAQYILTLANQMKREGRSTKLNP